MPVGELNSRTAWQEGREQMGNSNDAKFLKRQIVKMQQFRNRRDLLQALLDDEKTYTIAQVKRMVQKYEQK